jgi:hypothetical protein
MRVERVIMCDFVVPCSALLVMMVGGAAVAGGSDATVTVMVPVGSEDVGLGAVGDDTGAGGGAGESTGPMGPAGKLVLVGGDGLLSRYPARNFSISDRQCSRSEMMARRSSGRSLRPVWMLWRSSRMASAAAVKEGDGAARVGEVSICWGSSSTTSADEVISERGACLCLRWTCRVIVAEANRE